MLEPSVVFQNLFYAMAAILGTLSLSALRRMSDSIQDLNIKISLILQSQAHTDTAIKEHRDKINLHESEINKHSGMIKSLQDKQRGPSNEN